jgi:ureidoglycolate hydrolase
MAAPISAEGFAPYGSLIEWVAQPGEHLGRAINGGTSQRLDWPQALALTAAGGQPTLALFQAQARHFPFTATELEVHRLGSQTFAPLGVAADELAYVALVAQGSPNGAADLNTLRAMSARAPRPSCSRRALGTMPCSRFARQASWWWSVAPTPPTAKWPHCRSRFR